MAGYFHRVAEASPTRLWINNVTPDEARRAIEAGARGCTQNPTYPYKMLTHPKRGAHALSLLDAIIRDEPDDDRAQAKLQIALVKEIADVFLPVFERSDGREGYVTIQADPFLTDAEALADAARAHCSVAPNIMAKIPAVPAGFDAMERLLIEGFPVLATEVMSVSQALSCAEVCHSARQRAKTPPVMVLAHIPGIFEEYLGGAAARGVGALVAARLFARLAETGEPIGLCSGGARGLHHFTDFVGAPCAITINWDAAEALLAQSPGVTLRFPPPNAEEAARQLCARMPDFQRAYEPDGLSPEAYEAFGPVRLFNAKFEEAWTSARAIIAARREVAS